MSTIKLFETRQVRSLWDQGKEAWFFSIVDVVAVLNAFIHRDYASAAGSVSVALYDDRLEVISPGELHFGLTPEMLFQPHESKPWNPWIAKVFHRRGIIETWGRGTLKIASLMQAAGLPVPTLQERTESVVMTFVLPDAMVRLRKGSTPVETLGKTLGKTPDTQTACKRQTRAHRPRQRRPLAGC